MESQRPEMRLHPRRISMRSTRRTEPGKPLDTKILSFASACYRLESVSEEENFPGSLRSSSAF
jgi:hypothetical protein